MAINVYTGLMGSGKTYEAVSSVILSALKNGRRVVTNIHGLNESLCLDYLEKKYPDRSNFGSVHHVSDDEVKLDKFWPVDSDRDAVVKGGDLLVLDEAWRFFGSDQKINPRAQEFFRMHRHYLAEDGTATDIALVVQSISDLHRNIRAVVELTFRMTKIKSLGLSTTYRVEMFEGSKVTRQALVDRFVKRYDPAIFPLYKSYDGSGGDEAEIDDRQNILKNPKAWLIIAGAVACLIGGPFMLYQFFSPAFNGSQDSELVEAIPGSSSHSSVPVPTPAPKPSLSSDYRAAGRLETHYGSVVVLQGSGGLRVAPGNNFYGDGMRLVGDFEGARFTSNSVGSVGILSGATK